MNSTNKKTTVKKHVHLCEDDVIELEIEQQMEQIRREIAYDKHMDDMEERLESIKEYFRERGSDLFENTLLLDFEKFMVSKTKEEKEENK